MRSALSSLAGGVFIVGLIGWQTIALAATCYALYCAWRFIRRIRIVLLPEDTCAP